MRDYKWEGDLAKEKGNFDRAFVLYNQYLKEGGRDEEVVLWISDFYLDRGKFKKAIGFLTRMADRLEYPKRIVERVVELYKELGDIEEAENFLKKIPYGDDLIEVYLGKEMQSLPWEGVIEYINFFQGRENVHARMWLTPNGRVGYSPVKLPITPEIVKKHLTGRYTIGSYQLKLNGTISWAVLDLDVDKRFLKNFLESRRTYNQMMDWMRDWMVDAKEKLRKEGIDSYIEDSGFKGYHLWVLFENPIPAGVVKGFLMKFKESLKELSEEYHLEIFPKQTKVRENSYGNLVKLPGGVHLKTERRSYFLENEDIFSFLKEAKRVPADYFKSVAWKFSKTSKEGDKLPEPLILERSRELKLLRSRCTVIDWIVEKILSLKPINATERKVLEHTVGHLEEGPAIIHYLYSLLGYESTLKNPHKGNPISCARIKKEMKYITANLPCNCRFENISTYPNPLLHLLTEESSEEIDVEFLINRLLTLRREKEEVEKKLRETEIKLIEKIKKSGNDYINSKFGKIYISENKGEKIIKIEIT